MSTIDFRDIYSLRRIISNNETTAIWWYKSGFGTPCLKLFSFRSELHAIGMTRIHEILKSVLEGTYPGRGKGLDLGLHAAEQYFLLSGNIDLEEPPFCIWRNGEFTEAGKRFVESYEATVEEMKPLPPPELNDSEKALLREKGVVHAARALRERTGCSLMVARVQALKLETNHG